MRRSLVTHVTMQFLQYKILRIQVQGGHELLSSIVTEQSFEVVGTSFHLSPPDFSNFFVSENRHSEGFFSVPCPE